MPAVMALAAYYLGSVFVVPRPAGPSPFWDVGVNALIPFGAALVCWWRAWVGSRDRPAWALIGAGLASYATGAVVYYGMVAQARTRRSLPARTFCG